MEDNSLRVELEALLRAAQHRAVLDRLEDEVPTPVDAWSAIYACRAAGAMGHWQDAITWAERGLAQEPDDEAASWLHFLLGTALMYEGDPNRALKSLQHFLCLADGVSAVQRLIPDGWFNLGFAYRFIYETESEVAAFRTAAERLDEAGRSNQALLARVEAAWSYLMSGKLLEARLFLDAAEPGLKEFADGHTEVYFGICRALYHHLMEEQVVARQECMALLDRADLAPHQRADLLWLLGCLARSAGALDEARQLAQAAGEAAREEWWPLQQERVDALLDSLTEKSFGQ